MKIVAFDLGSNMAAAYRDWDGEIVTQHRLFEGTRLQRARETLYWARKLLSDGGFDAIVYERPFARGQDATRSLWGVAGILEATSLCPVLDYGPSEIKKWATGKGSADKEDMIRFAQAAGYTGENEHEADAFNLLRFAEATFTITKGKK